jgi:hypothetical protein
MGLGLAGPNPIKKKTPTWMKDESIFSMLMHFCFIYAFGYNTLSIRLLNHGHILQVMKSQGAFRVWNIIFKTTGVLKFDFS